MASQASTITRRRSNRRTRWLRWAATLPSLDPVSGEPRPTAVTFRDSRAATATVIRARPAGYLVPGLRDEALATLHLNGIAVCRLAEAGELAAEVFVVIERPKVARE